MEILVLAFLTCISLLVLLVKLLGWYRVIKYQKAIDIIVTVGLTILFSGTFSGMATAIIAGVMLSLTLSLIKKAMLYDSRIRS